MTQQEVTELIGIIPQLGWIVFIAVVIWAFNKPIRRELLPRMSGVKAFGLELSFASQNLDEAITQSNQRDHITEGDRTAVMRRAYRVAAVLQGAQILWVDDNPDYNVAERKVLRSLGIFVDLARSTAEALPMLRQTDYNAVISDMRRDDKDDAGVKMLDEMRDKGMKTPVIFYAATFDPSKGIPPYSFGMTNRPDQLLHYVMDVLERERS